jgi:hypothetical protein
LNQIALTGTQIVNAKTNLKLEIYQSCLNNLKSELAVSWFTEKVKDLSSTSSFYLAFGMLKRKVDDGPISISEGLNAELKRINPAFSHTKWTLVEFCRLAFLLHLDSSDNKAKICTLLASSDMKEQVVIYKSLQYLANAEDFKLEIIDGIRTNMVDVFDAIASENSYAFKYFSEDAWNHMVLKAIFMERPIYRIYGIDDKKNAKLAGILQDFVHERWAAGRAVTPELWRMISGFENDSIFEDLKKTVKSDIDLGKTAAIKVLQESSYVSWLADEGIEETILSWNEIGLQVNQSTD